MEANTYTFLKQLHTELAAAVAEDLKPWLYINKKNVQIPPLHHVGLVAKDEPKTQQDSAA